MVHIGPCGEMDITTVFGTVVLGSSPGGGTRREGKGCAMMPDKRIWFSGKTRPCQGRVGSSILPIRTTNTKDGSKGRPLCFIKTGDKTVNMGIKDNSGYRPLCLQSLT